MTAERAPEAPARRRRLTVHQTRVTRAEREVAIAEVADVELFERPSRRGDCLQGEHAQRPCPFVSCKHHLYLDVNPRNGSVRVNFPDVEVWDLPETCALDVADLAPEVRREVACALGVSEQRVEQIESKAIERIRRSEILARLSDFLEGAL